MRVLTLFILGTMTWSTTKATSCTASGAWTGTLATSGTKSGTLGAAGQQTFTLTCTDGTNTGASSVVVNVTP